MEYTQWGKGKRFFDEKAVVLILVVMEYTQWAPTKMAMKHSQSLNPCCNGIYSMRFEQFAALNDTQKVLILVVMEYTQWDIRTFDKTVEEIVLILVVMEYTQWVTQAKYACLKLRSLNPCCNGIYSMRIMQIANNFSERSVLILVVMEYTQWACLKLRTS